MIGVVKMIARQGNRCLGDKDGDGQSPLKMEMIVMIGIPIPIWGHMK